MPSHPTATKVPQSIQYILRSRVWWRSWCRTVAPQLDQTRPYIQVQLNSQKKQSLSAFALLQNYSRWSVSSTIIGMEPAGINFWSVSASIMIGQHDTAPATWRYLIHLEAGIMGIDNPPSTKAVHARALLLLAPYRLFRLIISSFLQ